MGVCLHLFLKEQRFWREGREKNAIYASKLLTKDLCCPLLLLCRRGECCCHLSDARRGVRRWAWRNEYIKGSPKPTELTFTSPHFKQVYKVGSNGPLLQLRKHGFGDVEKMSWGQTCSRTWFCQPSSLTLLLGWTVDSLCKGRLCVSDLSTTSMVQLFQRHFHFPLAAR